MDILWDETVTMYKSLFCPYEDVPMIKNSSHAHWEKIMTILYSPQPSNSTNLFNYTEHAPVIEDPSVKRWYENIEKVLTSKVIVAIAVFGVIGNILNLIVLTQKGLQYSMGRMEKFAHAGLISLAVSDMFFCLLTIPLSFVPMHSVNFDALNFYALYNVYSEALINIFVMASTMLTVFMATGRYFAIVHPIKARQFIGMTWAGRSILLIFIACIAFNIPRFWKYKLVHIKCPGGRDFYGRLDGEYFDFQVPYLGGYFVLGMLLPLVVLAVSNAFLIRALHRAKNRIVRFRKNETQQDTSQRVTLTLVIIVIFYLILVTPAQITNLWRQLMMDKNSPSRHKFNMAVAIVNTLESVNFSLNFVLYCVINTHFRRIVHNLLRCKWQEILHCKRPNQDGSSVADSYSASVRSTNLASLRTYTYNGVRAGVHVASPHKSHHALRSTITNNGIFSDHDQAIPMKEMTHE